MYKENASGDRRQKPWKPGFPRAKIFDLYLVTLPNVALEECLKRKKLKGRRALTSTIENQRAIKDEGRLCHF